MTSIYFKEDGVYIFMSKHTKLMCAWDGVWVGCTRECVEDPLYTITGNIAVQIYIAAGHKWASSVTRDNYRLLFEWLCANLPIGTTIDD